MSDTPQSLTERYRSIRENPDFKAVVLARSRLSWRLSAWVLSAYFAFMAVAAGAPALLHTPLHAGSHLSIGIPLASLLVVVPWLLTGWYVHRANTHFDRQIAAIVEEQRP
ncbi:DUF485 domain-containing protein [Pseudomonas kairouanensis]|uniref:DUF485 domain-containing protein n=1 Tax=Pseudomonas kairouanensis TaxID=2293832 RepID=A0A4Z0AL88_9PSED|nr:DUF485 domain-containing protein [Pseudomonas kairouanensis]TFY87395.1 DUF485 domain-containing protein [Pseudomonas kairouanensis]